MYVLKRNQSHSHLTHSLALDKTGPSNASTAILVIGDIFGFGSQVLQARHLMLVFSAQFSSDPFAFSQGADILAYGGDSSHQHAVYVPDFLRGQYAHHQWFTSKSSENQKAMGEYFGGPANPAKALEAIPASIKDIESESNGTIKTWAVLGLCWGGKVMLRLSPLAVTAGIMEDR